MDSLQEKRMKEINREYDKLRRNEFIYIMVSSTCIGYVAGSLVRNFFIYMGWM